MRINGERANSELNLVRLYRLRKSRHPEMGNKLDETWTISIRLSGNARPYPSPDLPLSFVTYGSTHRQSSFVSFGSYF